MYCVTIYIHICRAYSNIPFSQSFTIVLNYDNNNNKGSILLRA
ncbi:unnamed protein product [Phytomonas sp. Hart1]|nr:unnamed protein product [Phytomonas sp. Hart1]|eukprot:CCW68343.1 unnamed protein product [Phytomonas sp. isolate Hart1]